MRITYAARWLSDAALHRRARKYFPAILVVRQAANCDIQEPSEKLRSSRGSKPTRAAKASTLTNLRVRRTNGKVLRRLLAGRTAFGPIAASSIAPFDVRNAPEPAINLRPVSRHSRKLVEAPLPAQPLKTAIDRGCVKTAVFGLRGAYVSSLTRQDGGRAGGFVCVACVQARLGPLHAVRSASIICCLPRMFITRVRL